HIQGLEQGVEVAAVLDEAIRAGATVGQLVGVAHADQVGGDAPRGCRCGNTLRQRYDEGGLPCSSTIGSPSPTPTYAISRPRTRRRCFWYGNAAEILFASNAAETMFASPVVADCHGRAHVPTTIVWPEGEILLLTGLCSPLLRFTWSDQKLSDR